MKSAVSEALVSAQMATYMKYMFLVWMTNVISISLTQDCPSRILFEGSIDNVANRTVTCADPDGNEPCTTIDPHYYCYIIVVAPNQRLTFSENPDLSTDITALCQTMLHAILVDVTVTSAGGELRNDVQGNITFSSQGEWLEQETEMYFYDLTCVYEEGSNE